MKISELIAPLERLAPLALQESYDNCGLLVGDPNTKIDSALISLDCTMEVLDEAIALRAGIIISHHPLIFGKGLMKINESDITGRIVTKAIRNNIAIYALHTNLDLVEQGVNSAIAKRLGIVKPEILRPSKNNIGKLVTYVPVKDADKVRDALFAAGAGHIGFYSECSFNLMGTGTFKPNKGANPTLGKIGKLEKPQELKIEMIYPRPLEAQIIERLKESHPYEEVAYDLYVLENLNPYQGAGMIGDLKEALSENEFLVFLKTAMKTDCVRHTDFLEKKIKKVAFCGGSGSFLLKDALQKGANAFVTGDFKYHDFFDADKKILIADIGHYESEQFTPQLIVDELKNNFPTFALRLCKTRTNPINYF